MKTQYLSDIHVRAGEALESSEPAVMVLCVDNAVGVNEGGHVNGSHQVSSVDDHRLQHISQSLYM